jgi:hypothetical protein
VNGVSFFGFFQKAAWAHRANAAKALEDAAYAKRTGDQAAYHKGPGRRRNRDHVDGRRRPRGYAIRGIAARRQGTHIPVELTPAKHADKGGNS